MLERIRDFFRENLVPGESTSDHTHALQLATTALLFELARADDRIDDRERETLYAAVARTFSLQEAETRALLELAETSSQQATCLYEFTRLINAHYEQTQKRQIIAMLWQLAYSDGALDRYEEHYIRRVADLLYIPHKDFIATKHALLEAMAAD
ncbi:MAG: TerB family tellurite resistance protein [Granulosicoccaceae bacterium]|jgi:uncharacterized tellurite resistance protein B-like protein